MTFYLDAQVLYLGVLKPCHGHIGHITDILGEVFNPNTQRLEMWYKLRLTTGPSGPVMAFESEIEHYK